ncbi:glucoamylase family protein [Massilia sp. TSP1-1-2]|uniref:glucoamylase family protein n=1 Tax=Massilia sp. TSP1-1-2 TaxID=2804649 RepID=UPI003CF698AF
MPTHQHDVPARLIDVPALMQSDEAELDFLQRGSFAYFIDQTNPANGLVRDKNVPGWPASIAAVGMALLAYPVAVERALIGREAALRVVLTTLRFFWNSPQGPQADATGHHGFYYHFLDMESGRRAGTCELSTIDSAFLLAGALGAACYFNRPDADEQELCTLADALYRRADWQWAQNRGDTVTMGWKSGRGFLKHRWTGYNEALLLYILGLGSPTFPLPSASYQAWCAFYHWDHCYGVPYLQSGSLFTHQLSHVWIDFRGIDDQFMRAHGIDYFENSRRATLVQQRYAIDNPQRLIGYGQTCWGITASDGPGPATRVIDGVKRRFFDYVARGVPHGPDDGTIAPWAVIAALPFAPEIVLPTIAQFARTPALHCRYGYKTTFNATFRSKAMPHGWVSPWHFGIDQGPVLLMIENYRSGLPWRLMRACPYIGSGLRRAGFRGGWLDAAPGMP